MIHLCCVGLPGQLLATVHSVCIPRPNQFNIEHRSLVRESVITQVPSWVGWPFWDCGGPGQSRCRVRARCCSFPLGCALLPGLVELYTSCLAWGRLGLPCVQPRMRRVAGTLVSVYKLLYKIDVFQQMTPPRVGGCCSARILSCGSVLIVIFLHAQSHCFNS